MTPGRPGSGRRRAAGSEITENRLVRDRGGRVSLLKSALAEGAHSLGLGSSTYGRRSDARGRRGDGCPLYRSRTKTSRKVLSVLDRTPGVDGSQALRLSDTR